MTPTLQNWKTQLESLPVDDRVVLAHWLLESIDGPQSADIANAWKAELHRRTADINSGKVVPIDGDEVLAKLRAKVS